MANARRSPGHQDTTPAVRAPNPVTLLAEELRLLTSNPALAIWALYLLLLPIYVFSSGLPQPGDLMILPLLPAALSRWSGRLSKVSATG